MACAIPNPGPNNLSQGEAAAYAAQVQGIVACNYLEQYYTPKNDWQKYLAGLVGVYSIVKQYQIMKDYLSLAKDQVKQADRMVVLAEKNYNEIAKVAFTSNKALFDRYVNDFSGYEGKYLVDAFKDDCYTPDYALQRGRAIAPVQAAFDSAMKARNRARGKYNAGRACHDATYFAIETAKMRVAAADHAYRFEESRQWRFTQWYWNRKTQGVGYVGDMASRVITGINGGANVAMAGFGNISSALNGRANALQSMDSAVSNIGNFYGGIAQNAFSLMGRMNAQQRTAQFGQSYVGYGSGMVPQQGSAMPNVMQSSFPQYSPTVGGLIDVNSVGVNDQPVMG